jgi:hypothetical protein
MTTNIYVLEQTDNKYYVGKSIDVQIRFGEHVAGTGAAWTKKYKPIRILNVYQDASTWDEDRVFKSMVAIHGIDNVRGAAYTSITLTDEQRRQIQTDIWAATDKCTRCGRESHFITNCYAKSDIFGNLCESKGFERVPEVRPVQADSLPSVIGKFIGGFIAGLDTAMRQTSSSAASDSKSEKCTRCFRVGHNADSCYAKTSSDGKYIGSIKK